LAYLEAADSNASTTLIPCRNAVVRYSEPIGEYASIELELRDFAYADDLDKFRRDIEGQSFELIPRWVATSGKLDLTGAWVHQLPNQLKSFASGMEHELWQAVTKQLASQHGFKDHPFFYRVDRLRNLNSQSDLFPVSNSYQLKAAQAYRLRIIHYDPRDESSDAAPSRKSFWLLVRCEGEGLRAISSQDIAIDSPYDVHDISLRTPNITNRERSLVSLYRNDSPTRSPSIEAAAKDFDLSVDVHGNHTRTLSIAIIVGMLLGFQQLVSISKTPGGLDVTSGVLAISIGILASIVAAFGLRKPS
jgi:hypothetical protein